MHRYISISGIFLKFDPNIFLLDRYFAALQ